MAVIKASDRQRSVQSQAFSFDDLAQKSDAYLQQVRAQAAQIIADAQEQAASIRQQCEIEARSAAEESIDQRVQELAGSLVQQELENLRPALEQAVRDIAHTRQDWLSRWERQATLLAVAIAERITRRELEQRPEITLALVREALELAAGSPQLRIRLNPADHAALRDNIQTLISTVAQAAPAKLVADPTTTPGGCIVETEHGTIDQTIEAQLKRIEQELI